MALPLLARAFGSVISREAALGGATFSASFHSEILSAAARANLLGALSEDIVGGKEGHTSITVPVSSSAISSIGFSVGNVITVEFRRGGALTYEYIGSEEMFLSFLSAPSKGHFFNTHFKS